MHNQSKEMVLTYMGVFLMKEMNGIGIVTFLMFLILLLYIPGCKENPIEERPIGEDVVVLPKPSYSSAVSVEEALKNRRSIRKYKDEQLTLAEVSQLLWAAQGITAGWGGRTAPSAGALYPMEIYLVAGKVEGLEAGVYHYIPRKHVITRQIKGDVRQKLSDAALRQDVIREGPVVLIITAVYERTIKKYGQRGIRYVHMEVGHVGQNIYLQAETLGLGTVIIGAFDDQKVRDILGLDDEEPLAIMPVGKK